MREMQTVLKEFMANHRGEWTVTTQTRMDKESKINIHQEHWFLRGTIDSFKGQNFPGPQKKSFIKGTGQVSWSTQAAIMKAPQTGQLKQQIFPSHSSGACKSKIKVPADSVSGEGLLPDPQQPSSHCFLHGGRSKGALCGLFNKGMHPMRSLLMTSSPPKISHLACHCQISQIACWGLGLSV